MTADPLLVYGATGYTGRLAVEALIGRGIHPILAGRNQARLEALASELGCDYRTAALRPEELSGLLRDVGVVLLAAGPFSATAAPMVDACLKAGVHYLDLTGECDVIHALSRRSHDARRQKCMIMPGCGFDVVASDCLAGHVATGVPRAAHHAIGLAGLVTPTRGSLRTIAEGAGVGVRIRRNGILTSVPPGALRRRFDYQSIPSETGWSSAVTWGDVASAFHTTGIPNITVY